MKTTKLVIYNLLVLLAMLNVIFIYISQGLNAFELTKEYMKTIYMAIIYILVLFLIQIMTNLSYIKTYAKTKKNLLRVSLILTTILFIVSLILRIIEYTHSTFYIAGNVLMLIYLIIIIFNITMLKDLFLLVKRLFNQNN